MIPTNGSYEAVFEHTGLDGKSYFDPVPVEAWDDDGTPMVMPEGGKKLIPATHANSLGVFDHVEPAVQNHIAGAVPGGGWILHWESPAGDRVEPIVAWIVQTDGFTRPLTAYDGDATLLWPLNDSAAKYVRVVPPTTTP